MRHIPRRAVILSAVALAASAVAPASAIEPAPVAYVDVQVVVTGYVSADYGGFAGRLGCGLGEPQHFSIDSGATSTGPMEVPTDTVCWVNQFSGGDPGNLGEWGDWGSSGGVPTSAGTFQTITVTIVREFNGLEPEWDAWAWYPIELFTVDRVYVNRQGGITAEGLVWCEALADSPAGPEPIIGIDWTATQYVGRRTAIHGSYVSDIGKFCYDAGNPTPAVRWTSMHPAGTGAATAWVYGVDGKFASGTVIVEADSYNDLSIVTQGWDAERSDHDPACTSEWAADGFFDTNGDGFCAYGIEAGQRVTAAVRTTTWKAR